MTKDPIAAVIDELRGTTKDLDMVAIEHNLNFDDPELTGRVDTEIFRCETCGWWCEQSEMAEHPNDDWVCTDCYP